MTREHLDAIRAVLAECRRLGWTTRLVDDASALLAEVERLRDALAAVAAPLSPTVPDLWIGVQMARNVLGEKT
jgi:hypothetical protein